jgi:hypothetical protein
MCVYLHTYYKSIYVYIYICIYDATSMYLKQAPPRQVVSEILERIISRQQMSRVTPETLKCPVTAQIFDTVGVSPG